MSGGGEGAFFAEAGEQLLAKHWQHEDPASSTSRRNHEL